MAALPLPDSPPILYLFLWIFLRFARLLISPGTIAYPHMASWNFKDELLFNKLITQEMDHGNAVSSQSLSGSRLTGT